MHTEHEANLALEPKQLASWQLPSRCVRPQAKRTLLQRLIALFN